MYYSQNTVGGNSCGACASSYALQELLGLYYNLAAIRGLYQDAMFDNTAAAGTFWYGILQNDHIDPTKLAEELEEDRMTVELYVSPASPLQPLIHATKPDGTPVLHDPTRVNVGEGMSLLTLQNRAIGIYNCIGVGLHYILTKYDGTGYQIMDSNDLKPHYQVVVKNQPRPQQRFTGPLSANQTIMASVNGRDYGYIYLGACVLVSR